MDKKTFKKLKEFEKSDPRLTIKSGKATDPENFNWLIKEINKFINKKESSE